MKQTIEQQILGQSNEDSQMLNKLLKEQSEGVSDTIKQADNSGMPTNDETSQQIKNENFEMFEKLYGKIEEEGRKSILESLMKFVKILRIDPFTGSEIERLNKLFKEKNGEYDSCNFRFGDDFYTYTEQNMSGSLIKRNNKNANKNPEEYLNSFDELIGGSLSMCIDNIIKYNIPLEKIKHIYSSTRLNTKEDLIVLKRSYNENNDEFNEIANYLRDNSKIIQPKLGNPKYGHNIADGHWIGIKKR